MAQYEVLSQRVRYSRQGEEPEHADGPIFSCRPMTNVSTLSLQYVIRIIGGSTTALSPSFWTQQSGKRKKLRKPERKRRGADSPWGQAKTDAGSSREAGESCRATAGYARHPFESAGGLTRAVLIRHLPRAQSSVRKASLLCRTSWPCRRWVHQS